MLGMSVVGMGVVAMAKHGCGSHECGSHGCDRMRPPGMVTTPVPGQGASSH